MSSSLVSTAECMLASTGSFRAVFITHKGPGNEGVEKMVTRKDGTQVANYTNVASLPDGTKVLLTAWGINVAAVAKAIRLGHVYVLFVNSSTVILRSSSYEMENYLTNVTIKLGAGVKMSGVDHQDPRILAHFGDPNSWEMKGFTRGVDIVNTAASLDDVLASPMTDAAAASPTPRAAATAPSTTATPPFQSPAGAPCLVISIITTSL